MPAYDVEHIKSQFRMSDASTTTDRRGRIFEGLVCYVFGRVPGVDIVKRNVMNQFLTEEVDVAFWIEPHQDGINFLPRIVLAECKNWSNPVGSAEVSYFASRLANRGLDFGILVAANGITGNSADLTAAHFEVAAALSRRTRLIVITRAELERLEHTATLIHLLKAKLCEVAVSGSVFLHH